MSKCTGRIYGERTARHGVGHPVRRANGRSRQEDCILLDQGDGSGLDEVARRLNLLKRLRNVDHDVLRLRTVPRLDAIYATAYKTLT